MIEAVNSSVANAQALRGNIEQVSSSRSVADIAPTTSVDKVSEAPKAPYISPYIAIDTTSNKAVIQIRDSETGDVTQQFPTKSRLAQLSQLQAGGNVTRVQEGIATQSEANAPMKSQSTSIITVQDVTSSTPSNISLPSPQVATEALSAGAQSSQVSLVSDVSILA